MKNLHVVLAFSFSVMLLFTRCGKDHDAGPASPPDVPEGYNAADTTIGLSQGRVTLDIPAGALPSGTKVTMAASGAAFADSAAVIDQFKLLPEGTVFRKPVMLVLHYDDAWLKGNSPLATGVAFRYDKDGKWYAPIHGKVDTVHKTISVPITHFSDWSVYRCYHMEMSYEDQWSVDDDRRIIMPTVASAVLRCYMVGPPPSTTKKDVDDGDLALLAPLVIDPVSKGTGLDTRDCRDCDLLAPLVPDNSRPEKFKPVTPDKWYVNGIQDGDSEFGTISEGDKTSTYHSPAAVPDDRLVSVAADLKVGKKLISLIQTVEISGGFKWEFTVTTNETTKDPYSFNTATTFVARFFVHSDGRIYNGGDDVGQILYLDSVHIDPLVTNVTMVNYDQYTSYKVSYKDPAYSWLKGIAGVYYMKKKMLVIALDLTDVDDARVNTYCLTPHNGEGGGCFTDTESPGMFISYEREDLPDQDGYTDAYYNNVDELMGVTTVAKLTIKKLPNP
jgi:hypothetical protein